MLEVDGLTTRYGAITGIDQVSIRVGTGELVVLVGPNGAGKTTTLNTVAGLLRPATGRVRFDGEDVTGKEPAELVRRGLVLVPEHRRIFKDLTVEDNLKLAGITVRPRQRKARLDEVATTFPVLRTKWTTSAGFLSGGEAQQLAVARALMADPKLLLLDEPTLGLSPLLTDVIFDLVGELRSQGRTLLMVEQNARRALALADRGYVMRTSHVVAEGAGPELADREDLFETYVGSTPTPGVGE